MRASEQSLHFSATGRRGQDAMIANLMAAALARPEMLSLAAGFTDNAVLPVEPVSKAVAALAARGNEQLQYGTNSGRTGLRKSICGMLDAADGKSVGVEPEQVIVCNGSQQALYLLTQVFCEPGDIVLVEQPTYFVYLELLKGLGVEAVSLPSAEDGQVDVAATRKLFAQLRKDGRWERVRMAYLITYFANPSARCMREEVKRGLGDVFRALAPNIPILEDAAYRHLYFDEPFPARSTLALPEWDTLPLVYLGTFSKSFSSGMKTGYAVSNHPELLRKLLQVKAHQDFGSSNFNQAIIEEVVAAGGWYPHLETVRRHYGEKAKVLHDALIEGGLRDLGWTWEEPKGGLLMWLEAPAGFNTDADSPFWNACIERDVLYVPGGLCFAPDAHSKSGVRASFGALPADGLREAAMRFCAAAKACAGK